ncbi:MAG: pyruvate synthase [Rhodospirillales bacterium]|nr:pyruvate synthase [Rhodospirillales bacterium]
MTQRLLTGNAAAAWGARLARAEYVPSFPITPQTEIIETLSRWIGLEEMDARMVIVDSEHSMITAAGAAASTGVRVFTATSSQGLLYGMEMLYTVAGWRVPLVLVNVSRALAAPITLEPDHNDILAARDSGFLQIHCATCQEVVDSVLMAYRLTEDSSVRLPVIVNLDGFYLSFTREPVDLPTAEQADAFLPKIDPEAAVFRSGRPVSQAVAVMGGAPYSYFRYETHLAAQAALTVYDRISAEFADRFGRTNPALECYRTNDADLVLVMMGSFATKAKDAVDQLRKIGIAIGLARPRLFRPFPADAFRQVLTGKKGVAVIDQNLSIGMGGVLHSEVAAALFGVSRPPAVLASFVGGLGGRDIRAEEFYEIAAEIEKAAKTGKSPPPRLLYTETELREMRKLQAIAHVERNQHWANP